MIEGKGVRVIEEERRRGEGGRGKGVEGEDIGEERKRGEGDREGKEKG